MAKYPNDDLFESTKMSFGDHLEELRVALFRAVVGLVIGFAIGLFVSRHVMNWMQFPLKSALENYYIDKAIEDLKTSYPEGVTPEMEAFVRNNRLVYDETYLEAAEIHRVGAKLAADPTSDSTLRSSQSMPSSAPPVNPGAENPESASPGTASPGTASPGTASPGTASPGTANSGTANSGTADPGAGDSGAASPATANPGAANTGASPPAAEARNDSQQKTATQPIAATPDKSPKTAPSQSNSTATTKDGTGQESPIPLGVSTTPGGLSIHRDPIPPPSSYLVNFRTWRPVKMEVRSLNAQEAFMIWMKAGFISGIVVASPWIFWQVWQFVAAGLYPHEKNYVYMYLPFSLLLFLAGAGMAFFFVFEPVLDFLFSFNKALNIDPDPRISEWLGFVLILPLGFGISFQLPLVMLFINRLGLVSLATYLEKWRIAILAIFVISSILTPADPISIFLMAIPLTLLYFLGMGLCKWMPRIRNPYAETADA
jgi:sec-independent protein translocase protein TatC